MIAPSSPAWRRLSASAPRSSAVATSTWSRARDRPVARIQTRQASMTVIDRPPASIIAGRPRCAPGRFAESAAVTSVHFRSATGKVTCRVRFRPPGASKAATRTRRWSPLVAYNSPSSRPWLAAPSTPPRKSWPRRPIATQP
jgi:hypothetical protein